MITISSIAEIQRSSLPDNIKEYLIHYTQSILNQYQVNSLKKIGCIYYLENQKDIQNYHQLGLGLPLSKTAFEYGERIHFTNSLEEITLLHGCYIFNNDFAIDIFGRADIFSSEEICALLDTE